MLTSCNQKSTTFSLLHYNIKELRTHKIEDPENEQVTELIKFLNKTQFDILSLNEVEFKNSNLETIKNRINYEYLKYSIFVQANTGNNSTNKGLDLVNFGKVPGEYSTAALSRFSIVNKTIITELKWKDFFKDDLSDYKLSSGADIPVDIELFDKSFSDITILVENKRIHLILLHTVPSFGFGNKRTINFLRNKRQLDFLKWYLNRDGKSQARADLSPLKQQESFIVVGDLNVDIKSNNQGAKTLKAIIAENNSWIPLDKMDYTHPNPKLMLDYIIFSKNIVAKKGMIIKDASSRISDHLPIWTELEIE